MNDWLCNQLKFFKRFSLVAEILFVLGMSVYGLILVMYVLLYVKTLELLAKILYSNEVLLMRKAKFVPNICAIFSFNLC